MLCADAAKKAARVKRRKLLDYLPMHARLKELFATRFGIAPQEITALKPHASNRQLFRLSAPGARAIGVMNLDPKENRAFFSFTGSFRQAGIPVPEIYEQDEAAGVYLEEDLGDTTLFDVLLRARTEAEPFPLEVEELYEEAVRQLPRIQIVAGRLVDYSMCHPVSIYDRRSIMWDMHYFRESFLRRTGVVPDSAALQRDFDQLADFLTQASPEYFMYRDFQARNIMVRDKKLVFIDYQGGRKGPLQYDLVSLLYQSKALIPPEARGRLLARYLDEAGKLTNIDRSEFLRFFHGFVFIRLMQVLGTYGEKGLGEKKEYFLASIPHALRNLSSFLEITPLPFRLPELARICQALGKIFAGSSTGLGTRPLTVKIFSFSYRMGVPPASHDHGGGFTFDCRCLPNPGREVHFRDLTGLDDAVRQYLERVPEVEGFLKHTYALVEQSVENYLARGFLVLSVCYGCTGGQHRSVYAAEKLAAFLREKFQSIRVEVEHFELARNFPDRVRRNGA